MWPKALLEMLPHLSRLVPLANRYFQSRAAGEEALRTALEGKLDSTAASLRVDIEKTAETSTALLQQLSRQTAVLTQLGDEVRAIRLATSSLESRIGKLEQRGARHVYLFVILFLQLTTICILIVLFLFRRR